MSLQPLFVYGTLRPGFDHPMAQFLAARGKPLGQARARGRLYNLGRYPGVVESSKEEDWVHGDLIELPDDAGQTLEELDRYENAESPMPAFFDRRQTEVTQEDGTTVQAWIYWFRGPVREEARIMTGDWLNRNL